MDQPKDQNDDAKKIDDTVKNCKNSDCFAHSENTINGFSRISDENKAKTCINSNIEYGSNLLQTNLPTLNKSI